MASGGGDKATAFAAIDLLLNLVMVFVVVAVVAMARMNTPNAGKALEPKAEFLIEMTWANGNLDDLDLWLLTPGRQRVGFDNKDIGTVTLDRDDRGGYGDVYGVSPGMPLKAIRVNREVMTLRANVPGRYAVNVFYYHDFGPEDVRIEETDASPNPVQVKLTKLNPRLSELANRTLQLRKVGAEATAFCFEIDTNGEVVRLDLACTVPFVSSVKSDSSPRL